jgi:hypothetical protein
MIVPAEFKRFAEGFYQGSDSEYATPEEWIASALMRLDSAQKRIVKQFLLELLKNNPDEAELQRIWSSTAADYYIAGNNGLRSFFMVIRDMIE